MPKTKRSRFTSKTSSSGASTQQSYEESLVLEQFEEELARKMKKLNDVLQMELIALTKRKEMLKLKYLSPSENLPPEELSELISGKQIKSEPNGRKQSLRSRSRVLSSKDTNSCPTVSKDVPIRNQDLTTPSTKNMYKTPVGACRQPQLPPITPKFNPSTPVTVMRLARQGELAISMTGSPLLVTAAAQDKRAKLNVPLGNGRIISITGEGRLNPYDVPEVDEETKRQLQTLHDRIEALVNMSTLG